MNHSDDGDVVCPVCHTETCTDPTHLLPEREPPEREPPRLRSVPVRASPAPSVAPAKVAPSPAKTARRPGLDESCLADVSVVVAEGQRLEADGIPYLIDGLIPRYGGVGMLVAGPKVGKTTFSMQLGAAVACGAMFLNRQTKATRVLMIAAEDPPTYTAWLARHLNVPQGMLTFYRGPVLLDTAGLEAISHTVMTGGYGLVLIASWQAVVRGLVQHENDNAGGTSVVEHVKLFTRRTDVPWLIDSHAGKGEDQGDDADPSFAMRGASALAAAADYSLSLRYADGPFSTKRRLSGKGRFVNFPPMLLDCEPDTFAYTVLGDTKTVAKETTWKLIVTLGALTDLPQTAYSIAKAIGLTDDKGKPTATGRRQVREALRGRAGITTVIETGKTGTPTVLYSRGAEAPGV